MALKHHYYLSADYVLLPEGLVEGAILKIDDQGSIAGVYSQEHAEKYPARHYNGLLCPGFINAHTHIELSALRNLVPEGAGMARFGRAVVEQRKELGFMERKNAQLEAVQEAWREGVVGWGDVANTDEAISAKKLFHGQASHTFVEVLSADANKADAAYQQGEELLLHHRSRKLNASLAPHAVYSVSRELFNYLYAVPEKAPLSIHFLESNDELELFERGSGPLADLLQRWELPLPSPDETLWDRLMPPEGQQPKCLFVHLTEAVLTDLQAIGKLFDAWYCLCPRSNWQIHRALPELNLFTAHPQRLLFGTDSRASAPDLNVLNEYLYLYSRGEYEDFVGFLQAVTRNAADFFGWEAYGRLSSGKQPGIVLIEGLEHDSENRLQPAPQCSSRLLISPAGQLDVEEVW